MTCKRFRLHRLVACFAIILCAMPGVYPARAGSAEAGLPTLAPLVKRISPSVVSVTAAKHVIESPVIVDPKGGFPDAPLPRSINETASAVVLDAGLGLLVTANHVICDAETITVAFADGSRMNAALVATSPHDDLAIIRITARGLTAIALGEADNVEVGDFVLDFGNPLGLGQSTSFGIVSALHRTVPGIENKDLVAFDALIDEGSSGGALIDARGELVGINVARLGHSNGGGLGFAVPANAIHALLDQARRQLSSRLVR